MKSFLHKILLFIFSIIICYPLVTFFLGEIKPAGYFLNAKYMRGGHGFLWSRLREVEKIENIDVLILGSSIAYTGIDTRAFDSLGLKAFNLGSSNQTPLQTEYLLEKHLDRLNPSFVLWDVTPFTLENSGYESYIDLVSNDGANWKMFQMIGKHKKYEGIHTFVYVKMKELFTDYFSYTESEYKKYDKYIPGGFVEKKIKFSSSDNLENKYFANLKNHQKESLENSIQSLKDRNIKVFLISGPVNPIVYSNIINRKQINEYFHQVVRKHELEGYLDFNQIEIEELDPNIHYADGSHLNQLGVVKYNKKLIEQVFLNSSQTN